MKFLIAAITLIAIAANAQVFVKPDPNIKRYVANSEAFAPASAPTDLCVISGSATKVVKVVGVRLYANQTTANTNQFFLYKRSTANSGGTTVAISTAAFDTGIPAATASAVRYSANPTLGTTAGRVAVERVFTPASTAIGAGPFEFGVVSDIKPVILRGTADSLALSYDGVALPTALTINCSFEFVEE